MIAIEPADAWIFLAIARSDGAELADFYAAADHIGVALPSDSELEGGVRRLASCDWVAIDADRFGLTPAGRAVLTELGGLEAAPRPQVRPCQELLEIRARAAFLTCEWNLDPRATAKARAIYDQRMRVLMARLKRRN